MRGQASAKARVQVQLKVRPPKVTVSLYLAEPLIGQRFGVDVARQLSPFFAAVALHPPNGCLVFLVLFAVVAFLDFFWRLHGVSGWALLLLLPAALASPLGVFGGLSFGAGAHAHPLLLLLRGGRSSERTRHVHC